MYKSINPYNEKTIFKKDFDTDYDIITKLNNASKAYFKWRETSYEFRQEIINLIAEELRLHTYEYAETITMEMGKVIHESLAEVKKCALACEYYAANTKNLLNEYSKSLSKPGTEIVIEPTGAILGIMPWNFPFWQAFRFLIPNLMLGNVILLKHAPNAGLCASAINSIFTKLAPNDIFQVLWADISQLELVISDKAVTGTTLTGSEKAGASLAMLSGKHIKKTVLELGGSDPFIVDKTCNLEQTVLNAIKGRLQNNGQTCIAAKRFIIHEDVYDKFKTALLLKLATLSVGDPFDENNFCGTMARKDLMDKLIGQIEKATEEGAILLNSVEYNQNIISPVVLELNDTNNVAFKEELFGPVFVLISFKSTSEAIRMANETNYGLAASIWSNDDVFKKTLAEKTVCGNVFINELPKSDVKFPFGGTKNSGFGRELSVLGLTEFSNIKTIINH